MGVDREEWQWMVKYNMSTACPKMEVVKSVQVTYLLGRTLQDIELSCSKWIGRVDNSNPIHAYLKESIMQHSVNTLQISTPAELHCQDNIRQVRETLLSSLVNGAYNKVPGNQAYCLPRCLFPSLLCTGWLHLPLTIVFHGYWACSVLSRLFWWSSYLSGMSTEENQKSQVGDCDENLPSFCWHALHIWWI